MINALSAAGGWGTRSLPIDFSIEWTDVGVDSRSLAGIRVSDLEVVGMGTSIPLTFDCVRNP